MSWFLALSGLFLTPMAASMDTHPNVILVMTDDQGHGDLSLHGNPCLQTPNLDRLAAESARLGTFYVQPVCAPTRAALMTGQVPQRTTAIDTYIGRAMLSPEEITVAERLQEAGYDTGIFGKWHLGDCHPLRPHDQGFDVSLVHRGGGIGQPSDPEGAEGRYTDPVLFRNGVAEATRGYCTDVYFTEALKWMAERKDPFLCVITTNAPHAPYHDVPEALYRKYLEMDLDPVGANNADRTAREFAMIENIDQNMGRLLAGLDEMEKAKDTIVLFLHDNGPQWKRYNRGLRDIKGSVYEGGIRSPFLARWPERFPAGDRPEAIGQHVDVMPTILEAAGIVHDHEGLDGLSLMGVLRGRETGDFDRSIIVQSHRGDVPVRWHNAMIRRGKWKLVNATGFGRELAEAPRKLELYDLSRDPGEQNDLAARYPERVRELAEEYDAWFDRVGADDPANYAPPAISVGLLDEAVHLTRQDWRRIGKGGWAGRSNGAWLVDVAQTGPYRVRVRFLPKQSPPEEVELFIDGRRLAEASAGTGTDVVIDDVRLPRGRGLLEVSMHDAQSTYGAYQVIIEPVSIRTSPEQSPDASRSP